jgi:uncharacterized protein
VEFDFNAIAMRAVQQFRLDTDGPHGVAHWQRVQENGLRLAAHNEADVGTIRLFSFLHDCCRENDRFDPQHGPRAAVFAESLRGDLILAGDDEFEVLLTAIRDHTNVIHSDDVTIGTCWDADRLDIGRVGATPDRAFLNTAIAKEERILRWAYERSTGRA